MREQKVIVPIEAGQDVNNHIRALLADIYGGYTASEGRGGWVALDGELIEENVIIYVVATDNDDPFAPIAAILFDAGQQAVYTVDRRGDAVIRYRP